MIYVLGTGYCGTTLLGLILGNHPDIIDLGELSFFLNSINKDNFNEIYNTRVCTCGKVMKECNYWSGFFDFFYDYADMSLKDKYKKHYDYFKKKYPDKVFVDTSMRLDFFYQINDFINYPILITKDVRNWSVSVMKKHGGNVFKRFLRWYLENKKFKKSGIDFLKIGYEELALFNEEILQKIYDYIEIEPIKNIKLTDSKTHSLWGNLSHKGDNRIKKVFYDYRWFHRYDVCLAFTLMPFVKKLNEELVYSNNLITNFNYKDEK